MKNVFARLRTKGVALKVAIAAAALSASASSHAAGVMPAWATAMIADASDQVTAVFSQIGPVVGLSIAAGLVIKLVKRGAAKI